LKANRKQLKALQIGNSQSERLAECFRELLSIAFVDKFQDKPMRSGRCFRAFEFVLTPTLFESDAFNYLSLFAVSFVVSWTVAL